MIPKIPEKFSNVRHIIEKLYKGDDTFRSVYKDYQTYLDALQFWEQSSSDDAAARRSEYTQLVGELEEELMRALNKRLKDSLISIS
jgi:hypothetical protein